MKKKRMNVGLLFLALLGYAMQLTANNYESLYQGLPFEMPLLQKPVFPDREVSILSYGAIADGITLNPDAFNQAMLELSPQGGGTFRVP